MFSHPEFDDHEQVVFASDAASGLRAVIAVHSTALGPALGGCRMWTYERDEHAVADVLRLSRGMSLKAALAGLDLGGGKSVILLKNGQEKTPEMMRAMGLAIERLHGRYIGAEDVGATVEDIDQMALETAHVSGGSAGTGDPSPWTAKGVFLAMQAASNLLWETSITGKHVSVSGLGSVGGELCRLLAGAGARLSVSDIRKDAVERICQETGAEAVAPDEAHAIDCDVFAPCALGAVINRSSVREIRAKLICGAANNQLARPQDADLLRARNILYAPDYLINAGGLISVARLPCGMDTPTAEAKLTLIPDTLIRITRQAHRESASPATIADKLALDRIALAA